MMTTKKLYDEDAYRTQFNASVLSCEPHPVSDKEAEARIPLYDIVLDQTLFFPEEGGQNADTGSVNFHPVLDVQIKDGIIVHTTDAPFAPGSEITGQIDWKPRYSNMQQHSGEHIISGLVHSYFGYDNVGFHLGVKNVTLDFNGFLTPEQLELIETLANEAIYQNIEINAAYPPKEQLDILEYRSKIELTGPVRIVTIPGYDICACCAPHVKRTGEIGIIKITDAVRYKGGIRISIQCGNRALEDFRMKQQQLNAISVLLSAKQETAADAVAKLKEDMFTLKGQMLALQNSLIEQKAAAILQESQNLLLFESHLEPAMQKNYANLLTGKCSGICVIFTGNDKEGYRYIMASLSQDVRPLNNFLKTQLQAKGGGSKEMVQGSCHSSKEQICHLFENCAGQYLNGRLQLYT